MTYNLTTLVMKPNQKSKFAFVVLLVNTSAKIYNNHFKGPIV